MFYNNLIYEIKLLIRSNWLIILLIGITLLFAFATFNGNKNVIKRINDITEVQEAFNKKDSLMLATLIKIEKGEKTDLPYWQLPSEPMTVGRRYPRLAIMQPEALSFLATGQSDMYTHFKSPTVYGNNFALDYSEMVNPVQLLFGNFDLAFVIIYILPLLIIAFTFNVLSKEKELGTLRLLGAQPISVINWLLQKIIIRYFIFTIITSVILLITIAFFSPNAFNNISNLFGLFLLVAGYILFWFVTSFIVNIKINHSSKNALTLIGIWLLIVMVLPATVNQIGNSLYPTPSRLKMINEIRLIKKENEEKQNEIMSEYLRTHPELAQGNDNDKFGFWHNYFASEKIMEEKTKPLLAEYDLQLKKQQNLIRMFKYVSPAILMQQSLNNIAGTSEKHYNDYKKQVFEFSNTWRDYLVPMLFKKQKFKVQNYKELPLFTYKNRITNNVWLNLLSILILSITIFVFLGFKDLKRKIIPMTK
jgi:ABC-2 type transport system permease protein